ncbi:quercetin dioxygenase-like cupin family protein [Streptacidiphilus sp. BW17]|uniref:cupin domain-containing protein n=1 Tax=Streptacidiphilus sp. BW17 TaxID=3156274 RepID=UPI003511CC9B
MPVIRSTEAQPHEIHGARFLGYANPSTGAKELAAWRGEIPAGTAGTAHTVTKEEIVHLLAGRLTVTLDGERAELAPGDVLIVNAGSTLCVDNEGDAPAAMWTCTSVGLEAVLPDGSRLAPPWAN